MPRYVGLVAALCTLTLAHLPACNQLASKPAPESAIALMAPPSADTLSSRERFQQDSLAFARRSSALADAFSDNWSSSSRTPEASSFGLTDLMAAAIEGLAPQTSALLQQGVAVDTQDRRGNTALHHAAMAGHQHIVERLLQGQAHLDAQNHSDETPLYLAAKYGHEGVVNLLLSYGADPRRVNHVNQTPLQVAQINGHFAIATMLQNHLLHGTYLRDR